MQGLYTVEGKRIQTTISINKCLKIIQNSDIQVLAGLYSLIVYCLSYSLETGLIMTFLDQIQMRGKTQELINVYTENIS